MLLNKIMLHSYRPKGFTLIELLLYVSIASSVLLLATMTTISLLDVKTKNRAIAEVEQQGSHALFTIVSALRNGESITFPTPGVSSTTLTVNVYPAVEDPTRFEVVNQQLMMARGLSAALPLTSNSVRITSFRVSNVSRPSTPGSARVYMTVQYASPSGRNSYQYTRTFIGTATLRQP
jgi:type II secretory pathway pseudopilin PulG